MATTWRVPGASGTWNTGGNWSPSSIPGDQADVILDGSATAYSVSLDVDTAALNSLTIGTDGGSGNVTLAVGSYTLNVIGSGGTDTITLQGTGGSHITIGGGRI